MRLKSRPEIARPSRIIAERYRLEEPLSRGGMGTIWRAEHLLLKSPVAIKFLEPAIADDPEMLERFLREAQSAAAVRGAHVVQILDCGVDAGTPYISMELLQGESLDARLDARGALTPAELDKIFGEVATAVGIAHSVGVIHRDLKPGNIFLAREGDRELAKVLDFGIAKITNQALCLPAGTGTRTGILLGTPHYMSPEQSRGSRNVDASTDLWSLAIIAFECLTGQHPFSGETIGDVVVQICTEPPRLPSSLANVPSGFDDWFLKAVSKEPSERFASARQMAESLSAILRPQVARANDLALGAEAERLPALEELGVEEPRTLQSTVAPQSAVAPSFALASEASSSVEPAPAARQSTSPLTPLTQWVQGRAREVVGPIRHWGVLGRLRLPSWLLEVARSLGLRTAVRRVLATRPSTPFGAVLAPVSLLCCVVVVVAIWQGAARRAQAVPGASAASELPGEPAPAELQQASVAREAAIERQAPLVDPPLTLGQSTAAPLPSRVDEVRALAARPTVSPSAVSPPDVPLTDLSRPDLSSAGTPPAELGRPRRLRPSAAVSRPNVPPDAAKAEPAPVPTAPAPPASSPARAGSDRVGSAPREQKASDPFADRL
jgi:eukaryotic-like serine/threonine-protein kinase